MKKLLAMIIGFSATIPARAGEEAYLNDSCVGFVSVNFEYLATKSASADLFKGKFARNAFAHLFANFPLAGQLLKQHGLDPLLDVASDVQEAGVLFSNSDERRSGEPIFFVKGKLAKDVFTAWAAKNEAKYGFKVTTLTVEGHELIMLKTQDDYENVAVAVVNGTAFISGDKILAAFLKNKVRNTDVAMLASYQGRKAKAAVIYYKESQQRNPMMPKEEFSIIGDGVIEGGKVKVNLEMVVPSREVTSLMKMYDAMLSKIPQLKSLAGVSFKIVSVGETKARLTVEADDTKWKDYLRIALTPEIDPSKPLVKADAKTLTLEKGKLGRLRADPSGKWLAASNRGEWARQGRKPTPGSYYIIDANTMKVNYTKQFDLNENEKLAFYPTDIRLSSVSERYFVRVSNHFSSGRSGGNELVVWNESKASGNIGPIGYNFDFSPDGKWLASLEGNNLQLNETSNGDLVGKYPLFAGWHGSSFKWAANSKLVAIQFSTYTNNTIERKIGIFDVDKKEQIHSIPIGEDYGAKFEWIGSEQLAIVSESSNKLSIWNLKDDQASKNVDLPPLLGVFIHSIHSRNAETFIFLSGLGVVLEFHIEKGIVKQSLAPIPNPELLMLGPDRAATFIADTIAVWKLP